MRPETRSTFSRLRPLRSKNCDVVVNPQYSDGTANTISRKHVAIDRSDDGSFEFTDLGSMNGTFLNDRKTSRAVLMHGDTLQLGGGTGVAEGATLATRDAGVCFTFSILRNPPTPAKRAGTGSAVSGARRGSIGNGRTPEPAPAKRPGAEASSQDAKRPRGSSAAEPDKRRISIQPSRDAASTGAAAAATAAAAAAAATSAAVNTIAASAPAPRVVVCEAGAQTVPETAVRTASVMCQTNVRGPVITEGSGSSLLPTVAADAAAVMRCELSCGLCSEVLLEARLLPCTHAFCRACLLLDHLQGAKPGAGRAARRGCPVCKQPIAPGFVPIGSMHLENMVDLVIESLTATDQAKFRTRRQGGAQGTLWLLLLKVQLCNAKNAHIGFCGTLLVLVLMPPPPPFYFFFFFFFLIFS